MWLTSLTVMISDKNDVNHNKYILNTSVSSSIHSYLQFDFMTLTKSFNIKEDFIKKKSVTFVKLGCYTEPFKF